MSRKKDSCHLEIEILHTQERERVIDSRIGKCHCNRNGELLWSDLDSQTFEKRGRKKAPSRAHLNDLWKMLTTNSQ